MLTHIHTISVLDIQDLVLAHVVTQARYRAEQVHSAEVTCFVNVLTLVIKKTELELNSEVVLH